MSWTVTSQLPEDMVVLTEVQTGVSDRAFGIIAATLVEIHLTELLKRSQISEQKTSSKETVQEKMFNSSGPLGSFSAKIDLVYLMGMISEEAYKNLVTMKEIRNRFAHRLDVSQFSHQEISSRCFNMTLVDKHVVDLDAGLKGAPGAVFLYNKPGAAALLKDPKQRYTLCAHVLSRGLRDFNGVEATPYSPSF